MSPSENKVAAQQPKKDRKPLSKRAKISIIAAGWVALLGISVGAALLIKPAPEIVYTDAIIEAYKFSEQDSAQTLDTVSDLDYYGYYTPNQLEFRQIADGKAKGSYTISGLKNKAVEQKINDQIIKAASNLYDLAPERNGVNMYITASYFNILSFYIQQYIGGADPYRTEYFAFDLNTGEELSFDDLFSENLKLIPLLFNSFYNSLSTNIQFSKLFAERRLSMEQYEPDPTKCMAQYCPYEGETYDSIRALIADYDNQMANIEQYSLDAIQNYLAGEKKFYLNSSGPVFVLSDGQTVAFSLKDSLPYAVYLKNYRSSDSLFEDDTLDTSRLFFTQTPSPYSRQINEETDAYLFVYDEAVHSGEYAEYAAPAAVQQAFRDYIKEKGLNAPGEAGKYRHIYAYGNVGKNSFNYYANTYNMYTGYMTICINEMDKSYYDAEYRKAIIDNGGSLMYMTSRNYDTNQTSELSLDDGSNACSQQKHVIVSNSGKVLDDVGEVLADPPDSWRGTWEWMLKDNAYRTICNQTWEPKCYFDDEQGYSREAEYTLTSGGIKVDIKDESIDGGANTVTVEFNWIEPDYINPEAIIK